MTFIYTPCSSLAMGHPFARNRALLKGLKVFHASFHYLDGYHGPLVVLSFSQTDNLRYQGEHSMNTFLDKKHMGL